MLREWDLHGTKRHHRRHHSVADEVSQMRRSAVSFDEKGYVRSANVSSAPTVNGAPGPRQPVGPAPAAGVIDSAPTMRPRSIGILSVVLLALLAATGCAPSPAPPSSAAAKRPAYVRDF